MAKKSNLIFLILAILISSVGILSLFHSRFFLTDDGNSMVIRFSAFYETLRLGQFPVRFLSRLNFGFGYPVSDFLYPLFMYIGVPIHAIGFSFVSTIKIIIGLGFLSGTVFSYLWLRKLFDEKAALVGSIAYSLFPYHLFDIYKRGSVGEILALGIVPFIFWAVEKRSIVLLSLGLGLLITAHNSLALIFIPIILLYQILSKEKPLNILKSLLWGLGLSAFFWIPALYDKQFTVFDITKVSNYKDYFMDVQSIILVGIVFFVSIIFGFSYILKKDKRFYFFLGLTLASFYITLPISDVVWKLLPLASLIQFPFRFLSLTTLGVAFLLSYEAFHYRGKMKIFFIIFLISITFISARGFFLPQAFNNYPDTFYSTNQDSTTVKNEYMPKWVKIQPSKMPASLIELAGSISFLSGNSNNMSFKVSSKKDLTVEVSKVFFPGWKASVDGKAINIQNENPKGLIQIPVSAGDHIVHVYFEEGGLRLFSDLVSAISIVGVFVYFLKKRKIKI